MSILEVMTRHAGRIVLAAFVVLGVSGTSLGQARLVDANAARQPRVLVAVESLEAFGQDGSRIAWAALGGFEPGAKRCDGVLKERDLRTGRTWSLFRGGAEACEALEYLGGFQRDLAVAGRRVLVSHISVSNLSYHFDIRLARPGARLRSVSGQHIPGGIAEEGPFVPVPMAGDGRTLVYANISSSEETHGYGYVHRANGNRFGGTWGTRAVAASGDSFAAGRVDLGGCVCHRIIAVSPDGARLLVRSRNGPGGVSAELGTTAIMRTDGGRIERVLPRELENAQWSPDGTRLLSATNQGVVVTEVATGVTKLIPGAFNPSWSPDGTQLAYLRGAATHVFVEAVAGGAPRDVGPGAVVSWAPDGSRLFVFAANDLHEVELRSGARRPVVRGPESLIVSPDGRWVAFTRRAGNAGFFIAEVAGGAERRLAPTASDFTWSPDSRRIAFSQSSPERQQRFSVAAIDSPSVVDVAPAATAPVWSPDASRVAFLVQASAGHVVQVATPGEPPKPVARGENPRWSRDGKQLLVDDRNGRIAITRVVSVDAGSEAILRDVRAEQWLPGSDRVLVRLSPNDSYEAGEIAVADADLTRLAPVTHTVRAPAWTGVEVRDAARGRLRWRFATAGDPAAVALDGNRVAVLLSNGKKRRIEVRRSGTAGPIRSPAVSTDVTGLSLSGHWLVYLGRGAVRAVDIRSGRETLVARPLGTVIGLSVEGTRVAWGEQRRGRPDVILALDLPG